MTENSDGDRSGYCSVTGQSKPASEWTRADWEELPGDPDLQSDLGYELSEWEQFETLDGSDQVMFLPSEESQIKDAAFVVADESLYVDLAKHC